MASDAQWVKDVQRWCGAGRRERNERAGSAHPTEPDFTTELGYEAAHPALQAHHWPDATDTDADDPPR
ncbi:MAG: hypothetical protein ABIP61_10880 [Burkholderiaceae bacterium]